MGGPARLSQDARLGDLDGKHAEVVRTLTEADPHCAMAVNTHSLTLAGDAPKRELWMRTGCDWQISAWATSASAHSSNV